MSKSTHTLTPNAKKSLRKSAENTFEPMVKKAATTSLGVEKLTPIKKQYAKHASPSIPKQLIPAPTGRVAKKVKKGN